jgi:hypothetical protein
MPYKRITNGMNILRTISFPVNSMNNRYMTRTKAIEIIKKINKYASRAYNSAPIL